MELGYQMVWYKKDSQVFSLSMDSVQHAWKKKEYEYIFHRLLLSSHNRIEASIEWAWELDDHSGASCGMHFQRCNSSTCYSSCECMIVLELSCLICKSHFNCSSSNLSLLLLGKITFLVFYLNFKIQFTLFLYLCGENGLSK